MKVASSSLGVIALLALVGTASAQSKRYPPEIVDKDEQAAAKSNLWEQATNPKRVPYHELIKRAQVQIDERTRDAWQDAVKKLDEAVKLLPDEPDAYMVRAEAQWELRNWDSCASDYAKAWRLTRDLEPKHGAELRRKLGICQARAGKLAEAERTLADAAAADDSSAEIWMRLGEVRVALGKLEEGTAALQTAVESLSMSAQARWLLAGAYDRARRPSEAMEAARRAYQSDRSYTMITNPPVPLVGKGEKEYLLGVAYTAQDKPELALVFFRKFLLEAPDSPWRRRAEEHLRELESARFPETLERMHGGAAPLDVPAATAIVRKSMPQMRACAAKVPAAAFQVTIRKNGPRTPPARTRHRFYLSPELVEVRLSNETLGTGATRAQIDGVIRCIDPIARRIPMPAIKERDTQYTVTFLVVAP